ncbi:unnamed protein product [Penicillium salamii]|uniref:Zn(2)-C6 fungal-type domain-containing protein n=1 Tax=Penicillium salamii TaxID=1612424 RepID=A0A9W4ITE2_9EURO|nr:unnamed protein product [Penicillium salamii]
MRLAKACSICRERRRKCDIRRPGLACTYCSARNLTCTRAESSVAKAPESVSDKSTPVSRSDALLESESCTLPEQTLCRDLVQLYFDYVHDKFHSLFHRPSLMEDMLRGQAPKILIYGMLALSARFSTHPFFAGIDPRERGRGFAKRCEELLDLNDVSVTTIQACVLLGAIGVVDGKPASETIYYAVACRIAQLLDLPNCQAANRVEQELYIRVWWTLCMIDVWSSTGVRLPRLLTPKPNTPLPMNEATFLQMNREQGFTVEVETDRASSLLAQMVLLNRILCEINDFNIEAAETSLTTTYIMARISDLSAKLDRWLAELPVHMHDTRANLVSFASNGLGQLFITLYLGYYHYGQMLFYRFLHEDLHSYVPRTHFYANKCKDHAVLLCEMIYSSEEVPGCDVLYNMVGHVLVIASTVQIHTLLFGVDNEGIAQARRRLERNFCILTRLRGLWPTLDICMERLQAFHRACRRSVDTSFCMDGWMVRFLVEFGHPVSEREGDGVEERPWTLEEIGIS